MVAPVEMTWDLGTGRVLQGIPRRAKAAPRNDRVNGGSGMPLGLAFCLV